MLQGSSQTSGMWHTSGQKPQNNEGVYMFLRDVSLKDLDYRLVGDPSQGSTSACTGRYRFCSKIPKFVYDKLGDSPAIESLATLVGFDENEIMRGGWDPSRAKRLGELQDAGPDQKTFSEGIWGMRETIWGSLWNYFRRNWKQIKKTKTKKQQTVSENSGPIFRRNRPPMRKTRLYKGDVVKRYLNI